ncbi:putative Ig domain-containing protein [Flavobacteriaceae bacterium]|nr:putative Ig domain-containing protein [Flavobacteriaceae bacterium]MDB3862975.1 putative Ig domain-containing protein [Flavobacteriaceae bacterium]
MSFNSLSITATGLPPGVSMSTSRNPCLEGCGSEISGYVATISGTPTGTSSGTYNYTVRAVNSSGTASASYSGDITV